MRWMSWLAVLVFCAPAALSQQIAWEADHVKALEKAKESGKPVLIAVNMDKDRANDRLVKDHYKDEEIVELSRSFVCLAASVSTHSDEAGATCPRFGSCTCEQHKKIDLWMRATFYEGQKIIDAPQHIFLRANGKHFSTKIFYLTKKELIAVMRGVLRELGRPVPGEEPAPGAGEAADGDAAGGGEEQKKPETTVELRDALIKTKDEDKLKEYSRALFKSQDPNALPALEEVLANERLGDKRSAMLLGLGYADNEAGVRILTGFLRHKSPALRQHAAVALEDVADKSAVKAIRKYLKAEKEEAVRKDLVRALGSCGRSDRRVASELIKLTRDRSALVQRNAIVALGHFKKDSKVEKTLLQIAFKGGRGAWRNRRQANAAVYSLSKIGSKKALEEAEKRLERETNDFIIPLLEGVVEHLSADFDEQAPETIRWRRRAAGDTIIRDLDPPGAGAGGGPGMDGDGGDRPRRRPRRGGDEDGR